MNAATPNTVQSDDAVTIEIDGVPLQARRGDMVIEAADSAGITIPRFCYHKKLSIAANCRMCLVEVEKVPKPLPACATPVTEGMKVYTRSPKALEAQKGTMEFLLINHPLDCPICDQGGECDLQELSLGYGADHSRYRERKRVVKDKDIGPLIATEMTRCIHCTRCVRFGAEIAGVRELGATGRGENTRIGTYIEQAVTSEVSGNVIDLCPVGALTSKPFRFTARAWELERRAAIAPHDCLGSNLDLRVRNQRVMRVDPRANEAINEVWLSDRDRFSYEGLRGPERLTKPQIKVDGRWQETDWTTALECASAGLRRVCGAHGAEQLGALISPSATLEEMYLAQRLVRGLGGNNVDHRLRQIDFRDQDKAPLFPWLGQGIAELEELDAALLIGSNIRKEQPLAALRLRKAALRGAAVMCLNPLRYECNFPVAAQIAAGPAALERHLAGIAKAALRAAPGKAPAGLEALLRGVTADDTHQAVAARLGAGGAASVLLGNLAFMHPAFATLRALAGALAEATGARLGYLTDGANGAGGWLAGALPHRAAGGVPAPAAGLDAQAMCERGLKGYLLLGVEPEYDSADPGSAGEALARAAFVVSLTAFDSAEARRWAHVLLPVAPFTETSGTFVNVEGRWQTFAGAVAPYGEARPAWKVLRVLGNLLDLAGFEYMSSEEVREELAALVAGRRPSNNAVRLTFPAALSGAADGLMRIADVPIYAVDALVRRAPALQRTADADRAALHLNAATAARIGVAPDAPADVRQGPFSATLPVVVDERVPDGCVYLPLGQPGTERMGLGYAPIDVTQGGG